MSRSPWTWENLSTCKKQSGKTSPSVRTKWFLVHDTNDRPDSAIAMTSVAALQAQRVLLVNQVWMVGQEIQVNKVNPVILATIQR